MNLSSKLNESVSSSVDQLMEICENYSDELIYDFSNGVLNIESKYDDYVNLDVDFLEEIAGKDSKIVKSVGLNRIYVKHKELRIEFHNRNNTVHFNKNVDIISKETIYIQKYDNKIYDIIDLGVVCKNLIIQKEGFRFIRTGNINCSNLIV